MEKFCLHAEGKELNKALQELDRAYLAGEYSEKTIWIKF
jgi:hypothetical protein